MGAPLTPSAAHRCAAVEDSLTVSRARDGRTANTLWSAIAAAAPAPRAGAEPGARLSPPPPHGPGRAHIEAVSQRQQRFSIPSIPPPPYLRPPTSVPQPPPSLGLLRHNGRPFSPVGDGRGSLRRNMTRGCLRRPCRRRLGPRDQGLPRRPQLHPHGPPPPLHAPKTLPAIPPFYASCVYAPHSLVGRLLPAVGASCVHATHHIASPLGSTALAILPLLDGISEMLIPALRGTALAIL